MSSRGTRPGIIGAMSLEGFLPAVARWFAARGAMFPQELARATRLLPGHLEAGLAELVSCGTLTCDSYAGLRGLIVPPSRRNAPAAIAGRWSLFRREAGTVVAPEFVARRLLRRTGVVFRRTIARERQPFPWRDLVRVLRALELKGEVRGGRFVAGFDGEQFARPEAVELLRAVRKRGELAPVSVSAGDPLNFRGSSRPTIASCPRRASA